MRSVAAVSVAVLPLVSQAQPAPSASASIGQTTGSPPNAGGSAGATGSTNATVGSPAPSSSVAAGVAPVASAPGTSAPSASDSTANKPAAPRSISLEECLRLTEQNHPNLSVARTKVEYYRAQLDEAHFAPYSAFNLTAGAGPAPTFRGSSVYTQDREVGLNSNLGVGWQVNFSGTIPLWTFGKITNTWAAAEAQIKVGQAEMQKTKNAILLDVRKAYHGLQTAKDALALIQNSAEQLDKALASIDKRIARKDPTLDDVDIFRLKTARLELEGRKATAQKYETIAQNSLRFLTGLNEEFDVPPLSQPKHVLQNIEYYKDAMVDHRPELRMARAGLAARQAQVALAHSKMLPNVGLSVFASYSRAPEITDQFNPFVRDDANYFRYGVAIGMQWTLDFLPASARIRQAEAQAAEIRHTLRYAASGLLVEVENAYASVIEAKKRVDTYGQASKLARKWMVTVSQGLDLGTYSERDMVEPAKQYALQRYSYFEALYEYNMAIANLAVATGFDAINE